MEGKADLRTKPFLVAALVLTPLLLAGIHILETGEIVHPVLPSCAPLQSRSPRTAKEPLLLLGIAGPSERS